MKVARKGILLFVLVAAALAMVGLTQPFLRQPKEAEAKSTTTGEGMIIPATLLSGAASLGYTVVGNSLGRADSNSMVGSRFIMGSDGGTVTSLSVFVGNVDRSPSDNYQMAIYADNQGTPGTLVTRTNVGTLTANAWNTLPANATLAATTPYWLIYNTNGSNRSVNNLRYDLGSGLSVRSSNAQSFGSWPRTFGSASLKQGVYSIYATYLPLVTVQTPTPTIPATAPTSTPTVGNTPTVLPTATPVPPTATPAPTMTPAPAPPTPNPSTQGPPVGVDAQFYSSVKSKLKSGDIVMTTVIRNSADVPMQATDPKFQREIGALNSVNKSEIGVKKTLLFSSVDDFNNLKGYVPSDVDIIAYDMEGSMTPAAEFQNPPASVQQFADIAHAMGREMAWGPIRSVFDQLQSNGQLATILQSADMVVYQAQKYLPTVTVSQFAQTMQAKHDYVKSINPNAKFYVQLWMGVGADYPTMADAFNASKDYIDFAGIGTHNDLTGVQTVISLLNWR